jgi:hypothetical protein
VGSKKGAFMKRLLIVAVMFTAGNQGALGTELTAVGDIPTDLECINVQEEGELITYRPISIKHANEALADVTMVDPETPRLSRTIRAGYLLVQEAPIPYGTYIYSADELFLNVRRGVECDQTGCEDVIEAKLNYQGKVTRFFCQIAE